MTMAGAYFAFKSKDITIKSMNDAKAIGMAIYNIFIVGGLSYAVSFVTSSASSKFAVLGFAIWLCTTAMLSILYVPKMITIGFRGDPDVKGKIYVATSAKSAVSNTRRGTNTVAPSSSIDSQSDEEC
mmetsp:Transcript_16855/g.27319  ORF Transcript_16855/g.27319 Transcript_16855/m.27319 type:complete len:127 (-) Transcript_16855:75-455(-)